MSRDTQTDRQTDRRCGELWMLLTITTISTGYVSWWRHTNLLQITRSLQHEAEEDSTKTYRSVARELIPCIPLSQRRWNPIKLAYKLAGWPTHLAASAFNQLCQSVCQLLYCTARLLAKINHKSLVIMTWQAMRLIVSQSASTQSKW